MTYIVLLIGKFKFFLLLYFFILFLIFQISFTPGFISLKFYFRSIFKLQLPRHLAKSGKSYVSHCGLATVVWNPKLRNTAGRCRMGICKDNRLSKKFCVELAPHICKLPFGWLKWNNKIFKVSAICNLIFKVHIFFNF